jgi:hypothetical protein
VPDRELCLSTWTFPWIDVSIENGGGVDRWENAAPTKRAVEQAFG